MAVRKHPISGEPILYAPDRAGRPNAFGRGDDPETCPFCPGNESQTPPEILQIGDPWRIRVIPNKYPAIESHEVIVDSNRHDASFDTLENAAELIELYIARYRAHADAAFIAVFKNEGERAGASIEHTHSQVMPVAFVPPRIERYAAAFARARACPLCEKPQHLIEANDAFFRAAPDGTQHAYEQWIVPQRHLNDITNMRDSEVEPLAAILQSAVRATRLISRSYNVLFMNFPKGANAHFYVNVVPRLAAIAGFELSTGTFIDIIDPALAAQRLK